MLTSRSSALRRTTSSPTARDPLRPACHPRRQLPAGPHLEAGVDALRRAAGRRLRRRRSDPGRPRAHARRDRAHGRRGRRRGRDPDRSRRRPLDRRARHPRLRRAPRAASASSTSTPTPTPARRSSASRSRTARRCTGWSSEGHVDPRRYVQIGLRGYWPGEAEFAWQARARITSLFMHDVRELGHRGGRRADGRDRRRRAGVPLGRRRRPRPGLRPGHGDARSRAG